MITFREFFLIKENNMDLEDAKTIISSALDLDMDEDDVLSTSLKIFSKEELDKILDNESVKSLKNFAEIQEAIKEITVGELLNLMTEKVE